MSVVELTESLARPITDKLGLTLWDVEFKKEGSDYILRVTVDRPEGVSITDCENVNAELSPLLDEADPIEQSYCLEVTSAGLVRDLKKDFHIQRFIGSDITIKLYKPRDGCKTFEGKLSSYENRVLVLLTENGELTLNRDEIARISVDLV